MALLVLKSPSKSLPYIPPMSDIEDSIIYITSETESQPNSVKYGNKILVNSSSPKSKSSPSAVLFAIKNYELPIESDHDVDHQANQENIGERFIQNIIKKSKKNGRIEEAEPDPENYDDAHWQQYVHKIRDKNNLLSESGGMGYRFRIFQCFSFLACLLSIVALLTDNLTSITGQQQYGYYSDSIVCGWNAIHMVEYDVSFGITETTIKYDSCAATEHSCHNQFVDGIVWLLFGVLAISALFTLLLLFCCVFPLRISRFKDHTTVSGLLLALNILFQVVAVIVWVSYDYCSNHQFIQSFYDKNIQSVSTGPSIDVMMGSILCSLICASLIVCLHMEK